MESKIHGIPILTDDMKISSDNDYHIKKFNIDGEIYYFKTVAPGGVPYSELIANEFARDYGIPCVEYYYAKYNDYHGYLSKDFSSDNQKLMNAYLKENDTGYIINSISNISHCFEGIPARDKIVDELYNLIVFDIIIGNADRHDENIIVTNDETVYPIFDNDWTGSSVAVKEGHYALFIDSYYNSIFDELYRYNREYYDKLMHHLRLLNYKHLKDVLNRVEDKMETPIKPYDRDEIIDVFTFNKQNIEYKLSKVK